MITFSYPGYAPTQSVSLGSPEKGDDEVNNSEVFIHPTESGQYKSNVVISCTGDFERSLAFTGLCKPQIDAFIDFIKEAYGHYIKYTDYAGISWMTQITTEQIMISNSPTGWNLDLTLLVWEAT